MRKALLAVSSMLALAAFVVIQRPITTDAATTVVKITNGTFAGVTRDDAGKLTEVKVSVPTGATITGVHAAADDTIYVFKIVNTSSIKDKQGAGLNSKYLAVGDTVSVWATALTSGNLIKLVDKSVWKATLTGTSSDVNDEAQTFGFRVDKRIAEIAQNASYSLTIKGQEGTVVRQLEIKKTGRITTRTQKTKAWTDVDAEQVNTVSGYWNAVGKFITATKIQLPNLNVTS